MVTAKDPPNEHIDSSAADDPSTSLPDAAALAAAGPSKNLTLNAASELLELTVEHPANSCT